MAYHQCDKYVCLLLLFVINMAVSTTMAESCGRCQYYDPDIEECTDCSIACNPAKNHCERVCPDWPDCQSTTLPSAPTTQMSTSSQWPWIVVPFMVVLLASILTGACWFWKRRGGSRNTNVCWRYRKDEEIPSVVPLMTIYRDDVPPQRDAVPPQCDAVPPQCDPTKGPCDRRHPMAFSGNGKNCVV
ncbi:hypothetical protein LSAT2_024930 [Lamellibrachia satsuma]|nr:hypothetical protein LSAT2_024930 [Lamellibrachia satsuma]